AAGVVRTGWGAEEVYRSSAYDGVEHGMPGIDLEGARFLAERGAAVVGSDTLAVERLPAGRLAGPNAPVHRFMLAERGIHLVENLNLEELAERKIGEFLFW